MQELKKILEKMGFLIKFYPGGDAPIGLKGMYAGMIQACEIIKKHMNDGWIPVEERLPEEKINPATQDFYEYQVTAKFGNTKDVRHYKYGNGHWWYGPGIVDEYVIAWRERPEPYCPERNDE